MSKFQPWNLYKHDNTLDMHIFVMRVEEETPEYTKLRVLYTYANQVLMHVDAESVVVKRHDYKRWKAVA
jgi:hypothetical protein